LIHVHVIPNPISGLDVADRNNKNIGTLILTINALLSANKERLTQNMS